MLGIGKYGVIREAFVNPTSSFAKQSTCSSPDKSSRTFNAKNVTLPKDTKLSFAVKTLKKNQKNVEMSIVPTEVLVHLRIN